MRDIQRVGPYVEIVESRAPDNHLNIVKVGVVEEVFDKFVQTGQSIKCAQFFGIIQPGLTSAVHAFKGLNRPLMRAGDMEADKTIVIYSWRPRFDYVWSHGRFNGNQTTRTPPSNEVFVVLVQQLAEPEHYPGYGSIIG